jgi:tetratricopeptide (TPR) repeat protein
MVIPTYAVFVICAPDEREWALDNVRAPLAQASAEYGDPLEIVLDESREPYLGSDDWRGHIEHFVGHSRFIVPVFSEVFFESPHSRFAFERACQERQRSERLRIFPVMRGHPQIEILYDAQPVNVEGDVQAVALLAADIAGRYRVEEMQLCRVSLAEARQFGLREEEIRELSNIGRIEQRLGRNESALAFYRQALELSGAFDLPRPDLVAQGLANIGAVEEQLGRYADALASHEKGLRLYQEGVVRWPRRRVIQNPRLEAVMLESIERLRSKIAN